MAEINGDKRRIVNRLLKPFLIVSAAFVLALVILIYIYGINNISKKTDYLPVENQRKTYVISKIDYKMIYIPAGTFMMGSPLSEKGRNGDEDQHKVTLTKGFYIGESEVTVGQWRKFINDTGYKTVAEKRGSAYVFSGSELKKTPGIYWDNPGFVQTDDHPVSFISWNDTQHFIRWLNEAGLKHQKLARYVRAFNRKIGKSFILPTEAQWEYACRAGSQTAFANGDILNLGCEYDANLDVIGWYCGNSKLQTQKVMQKIANAWGLFDMHGNVWEHCNDIYDRFSLSPQIPVTDPKGPPDGKFRVIRGGSFYGKATSSRSANRDRCLPGMRINNSGFRLVSQFGDLDFYMHF